MYKLIFISWILQGATITIRRIKYQVDRGEAFILIQAHLHFVDTPSATIATSSLTLYPSGYASYTIIQHFAVKFILQVHLYWHGDPPVV
jgi:hypothetical protein